MRHNLILLFALLTVLVGPAPAQPPVDLRQLGHDGYIYGLPLVMNYTCMYEFFVNPQSGQFKAPFNQLYNDHRVFTYEDTTVVTPNSDTPYSMAGLDLRAEPVVVTVPPVEKGRYFSVQVVDWNTFNVGYIGSRSTGNGGGSYLVAGPDWQGTTPPGIGKVIRSTTRFTSLIFRTQLFNDQDMPQVEKIQAGYRLQPLSAFLHQPTPPAPAAVKWPEITPALAKTNFFEYVNFVLQFAPAGPEETEIRARLAGLRAPLTPEQRALVAQGVQDAELEVKQYLDKIGKNVNGWHLAAAFGDREFFQGNWLLRASGAQAGIYGNNADEATYPLTRSDAQGQTLDGSQHNYTLTFQAGQLPPVNAFWSVTMYDGKTQLLIKNPINRYLINSPMLDSLRQNPDGSLTLFIQKDSPGPDRQANWLPAPDGPIYLVMRLYWPKTNPPSILPVGEGAWSPPGVATTR